MMHDILHDQIIMPSIVGGFLTSGKRSEAVLKVWEKLVKYPGWKNDPAVDDTNEKDYNFRQNFIAKLVPTIIWAPPVANAGEVFKNKVADGTPVLYLSPTLEFETMPRVMHVVAHELCHIALKHHEHIDVAGAKAAVAAGKPHRETPHEIEADALAAKIGFPKPKNYNNSFFSRTVDMFMKRKGSRSQKILLEQFGVGQ